MLNGIDLTALARQLTEILEAAAQENRLDELLIPLVGENELATIKNGDVLISAYDVEADTRQALIQSLKNVDLREFYLITDQHCGEHIVFNSGSVWYEQDFVDSLNSVYKLGKDEGVPFAFKLRIPINLTVGERQGKMTAKSEKQPTRKLAFLG